MSESILVHLDYEEYSSRIVEYSLKSDLWLFDIWTFSDRWSFDISPVTFERNSSIFYGEFDTIIFWNLDGCSLQ